MSRTSRQSTAAAAILPMRSTPTNRSSLGRKQTRPRRASKPVRLGIVEQIASLVRSLTAFLPTAWLWFQAKRQAQLAGRRLRMRETLPLGEKRMVALVELDGQQFLLGVAPTGISMLAELNGSSIPANERTFAGDPGFSTAADAKAIVDAGVSGFASLLKPKAEAGRK